MKTKEEILKEISSVLETEFEVEPSKLVPGARLYEDLDLDSIDAVDLVVRLQQRTGIKVVADDFKTIRTLGDVVEVIEKLLAGQAK